MKELKYLKMLSLLRLSELGFHLPLAKIQNPYVNTRQFQAFVEYSEILGMLYSSTMSIDLKLGYPAILAKTVLLLNSLNCITVCVVLNPLESFGEVCSF